MALINCRDCNAEISSNAPSCLKCGCPVSRTPTEQSKEIVTTQQTSKVYKGFQLFGVGMILVGSAACVSGDHKTTAWMYMIGVTLYIGGRFAAWWNNG